ncbi:hypothetical protein [Mucilaginibacter flavidus]|uniref:hypothetical protein n=1 Tax=Mucilaginibacter flavidus TaxID=2949309 RepID=UPI002093F61F|nr:hypothetical protein [Mucilaginibacter flavidus]MCO5947679.1 hypothetical protein [Mucilaginibacter flavidus]
MSVIGKLIYRLYFQRKNARATLKKFGGEKNYLGMLAAEQEMKSYALNDLEINSGFSFNGKFKINFLTGDRFIHQTLFCTYSYFKFLTPAESGNFSVNYYSDGTLSGATLAILKKRFPNIRVIDVDQTKLAIQSRLPESEFPYLNKKINALPLFKKLIYPHLENDGLSAFFDSDMLFIKKPIEFLNWLHEKYDQSNRAFGIHDVSRSYGYSESEILKIWPIPVRNNINSGMYALYSERMDFSFIESMVKAFEDNFGSQYYLEQLITAIILEKSTDLYLAPKSSYIVLPTEDQVENQIGTLHHYVDESKEFYFKKSWKKQVLT